MGYYALIMAGGTGTRLWPLSRRSRPKQTIDYGVMEGAEDVAAIPVDIGWSDVGGWASLPELLPADEAGNIVVGQHAGIDTHDTLVFAGNGKRLVATIGVERLVIVDTEAALADGANRWQFSPSPWGYPGR